MDLASLPVPVAVLEGKSTVLTHIHACADFLQCTPERIAQFIAWKVRVPVVLYPTYLAIYAPLTPDAPQRLIHDFINTCLRCAACHRLSPEGRCTACGKDVPNPIPPDAALSVVEVLS
jgi:hypothetical protein